MVFFVCIERSAKSTTILLLSIFCLFFYGCNSKKKVYEYAVEPSLNKGNFTIVSDTSIVDIFGQCIVAYEHLYDSAHIEVRYRTDENVINVLENKESQIGALHRKLTNNEYNRLLKVYSTMPLEKIFAYDAIVIATAHRTSDTSMNLLQVKQMLQKEGIGWATLPQYQYLFKVLLEHFDIKDNKKPLTLVDNIEKLSQLASQRDMLCVLPFSSFSDEDNASHRAIRAMFSFISIINEDKVVVYPSQEDIYLQLYPLIIPYNMVLCKVKRSEGMGFVNFLFSPQVGKMMLKNGLVPAKMPERLVEIK